VESRQYLKNSHGNAKKSFLGLNLVNLGVDQFFAPKMENKQPDAIHWSIMIFFRKSNMADSRHLLFQK